MVSFAEHPEVFCTWAKSHEDREEALAKFAVPVLDGTWTVAPAVYVQHLAWFPFWEPSTRAAASDFFGGSSSTRSSAGSLSDAAHAALPGLFNTADVAPFTDVPKITAWLVKNAGPNDATTIADVLMRVVWSRDENFVRDCFPLVEWLLAKGSSELRSGRRSMMVAHLLPLVVRYGAEELLAPAVRYILYNEHRVGADGWGHQTIEKLLPAVERLLDQRPTEVIIDDLLAACDPGTLGSYFEKVLRSSATFPRSRAAMVKRLARGDMTSEGRPPIPETWVLVVAGPAIDVEIEDLSVARAAAEGLARYSQGLMGSDSEIDAAAAWGHIVAREFLRSSELLAVRNQADIRQLQTCAGFDKSVAHGVYRAVREGVEQSHDPTLDRVLELLVSPGTESTVVIPALELLASSTPSPTAPRKRVALDHVVEAVARALRAEGPTFSGFNLKEVVGGAVRVEVADLPDERAFLVDGDTLAVSKPAIERLCGVSRDTEVQRALSVLYTVHEAVHDYQRIAAKSRVSEVRFAGAESALMHVDLGADHIAAAVAASDLPRVGSALAQGLGGQVALRLSGDRAEPAVLAYPEDAPARRPAVGPCPPQAGHRRRELHGGELRIRGLLSKRGHVHRNGEPPPVPGGEDIDHHRRRRRHPL